MGTSQAFILGDSLSIERLTWLAGCLKYSYLVQYPDALRHSGKREGPIFILFITGDALYSLHDRDLLNIWDMILSLPGTWVVCDREELDIRGLSVRGLKMKYPDQIFDQNGRRTSYPRSFWRELIRIFRKHAPEAMSIGYLHLTSPYMNRSGQNPLNCLHAAAEERISPELYAFLDGIHIIHIHQRPAASTNIGRGLVGLESICRKKELRFVLIADAGSAASRGYVTWKGNDTKIVSGCTIHPAKIMDLNAIVSRMKEDHAVLCSSAASISPPHKEEPVSSLANKQSPPPPVVILLCHTPCQTEHTLGGLSLAMACAHNDIPTRVVFIEDAVYSLLETPEDQPDEFSLSVQGLLSSLQEESNLEVFVYRPSLTRRGIVKNKKLTRILEIDTNELGQILFSLPQHVSATHQRILFI
jgi:tRNA 2-thiouridine synthesizing protein C